MEGYVMSREEKLKRLEEIFSQEFNYDHHEKPIDVMTYRWPEGDTCLHIASVRGDMEAVSLLVELGADVNALGDLGQTPLHYAAIFGHEVVYNYLISKGASPDLKNEFGKTPTEVRT